MTVGAARAGDDETTTSPSGKDHRRLMAGIGATNMDNKGIDYRERSPLVVPPKLDLPPPAAAAGRSDCPELAERSGRKTTQGSRRGQEEKH